MVKYLKKYNYKKPENHFFPAPASTYTVSGLAWLDAASLMVENNTAGGFGPFYYLINHACELFLKAFLLQTGVTHEELQKYYSHNLEKLLNDAISQDLMVDEEYKKFFDVLINSSFEHMQRYPLNGHFILGDEEYVDNKKLLEMSYAFHELICEEIKIRKIRAA